MQLDVPSNILIDSNYFFYVKKNKTFIYIQVVNSRIFLARADDFVLFLGTYTSTVDISKVLKQISLISVLN